MKTTSKPYSQLARVYDLMGADRHSIKMTDYCRVILRRFKIHPTTVLDLCCGTGTALRIFSDWGLTAAGLDQSAPMLAVAAKKLKGRKIRLYQKTLPRFALLESGRSSQVRTFDLVTSFYDALNYLTNVRDLKTAFRSVYRHLKPGGWFIFDMNTEAALKILWGGQVYAGAMEDIAWVWQNHYFQKRHAAECRTTCFVRKGKLWERFDELHFERAYTNEKIEELLRGVGFEVKGLYKCHTFRRPTKNTYRIGCVARRK